MSIGPRRIAELLGRGRVVKRHLRVSGRREPIYVSPDAQLKYALPGQRGLDRDLIVVAEIFVSEGMAVWDVGANVGIFAIAAASRSGSGAVLAIEADPWLAELIDRTRRHPKHRERSIQVLCAAISDSDGVDEFVIAERGRASNALKGVGRS
ncbi:MAG: FkbM family methyltransferase, partial [Sphingomonadaceae bacterium]|nr:FkbM family methyltransferase [Sphingomonadaceae bacterium]